MSQPDIVDDFRPLSASALWRMLAPMRAWHRPWFAGLEQIDPQRPALLVGNHTVYGGLDAPHMVAQIYRDRGVLVRSLGDRVHFAIPGHRDVLTKLGVVIGTRENCSRLMKAGQHVLVFPGGGREVAKRKGEAYRLIWKERTGFVRMAIEHGYPIIPFACVGPEECYDLLFDADDLVASPLGRLLRRTGLLDRFFRGGDSFAPLARGLGLTVIPRPERFYFSFGAPIATRPYAKRLDDGEVLMAVRAKVRREVESHIRVLFDVRDRDPRRDLLASLVSRSEGGKARAVR
ncbi:MAG: lysophospholipid acyltransferase family protein [Steroidobacteraceae bacterium]